MTLLIRWLRFHRLPLAFVAIAYVTTFLVWSYSGKKIAEKQGIKGVVFVDPSTPSGEVANILLFAFYSPLIYVTSFPNADFGPAHAPLKSVRQ